MIMTAAVVVATSAAVPQSSDPVQEELAALRAELAEFAQLQASDALTTERATEIRATVRDALADASSRTSLQGAAATIGFDRGFVMTSADGNLSLRVGVLEQVRFVWEFDTDADMGFDCETCAVMVALDKQSPDISMGVTEGEGLFAEQGAGDQGLMFGYACTETPELMPMPIQYAHGLTERLSQVRKENTLDFLRPDGKSQVTILYEDGKPKKVHTVVIAAQHNPDVTRERIEEGIVEEVIKKVIPAELMDANTRYLINATGRFVVGGPLGDCGLTGRKIIVDTYGGHGAHGGGAFSGKDPSKVDRSASYMARHVAKNVVAAGLADKCLLQVAYAIGYPEPVSLMVNTYGTGKLDDDAITDVVTKVFSFKPAAIIRYLDLLRPIYQKTAANGHFGREDPDFTWENTSRAQELRDLAGL